jgi:hypothetical protein
MYYRCTNCNGANKSKKGYPAKCSRCGCTDCVRVERIRTIITGEFYRSGPGNITWMLNEDRNEFWTNHKAEMNLPTNEPAIITLLKKGKHEIFDHSFRGFGIHRSIVRVHLLQYEELTVILFQDLGVGTSVTNASEQLATEIHALKKLDHSKTTWFECYPYYSGNWDIDAISYAFDPVYQKYSWPAWSPVRNAQIVMLIRNKVVRPPFTPYKKIPQ